MRKADTFSDNDPYVVIFVFEGVSWEKAREKSAQFTSAKDNARNPEWDEQFTFEMYN